MSLYRVGVENLYEVMKEEKIDPGDKFIEQVRFQLVFVKCRCKIDKITKYTKLHHIYSTSMQSIC